MIAIGHRGAAGHEPENTLLSVQKALDLGASWIEVDVYCVEGRLLVFHDDTLERTTNGSGEIQEKSLAYIRSLDAGKGEKIPYLEEVLELMQGKARLNVELKGPKTAIPSVDLLNKVIDENKWGHEDFILSSFDHKQLNQVSESDSRFQIGVLLPNVKFVSFTFMRPFPSAYSVNLNKNRVNRKIVDKAHKRGHKVLVYTVNETEDIIRMKDLGVDAVFSDYPDRVLNLGK